MIFFFFVERVKRDVEEESTELNFEEILSDYFGEESTAAKPLNSDVRETRVNRSPESNVFLDETSKKVAQTLSTTENNYDYHKLKEEYYQQIDEKINKHSVFNYTASDEEENEEGLGKIFDATLPKNCTKAESTQVGVKAIKCLISDYKRAQNQTQVKDVFVRALPILKFWLIVYLVVAIPCWCYTGDE